MKKILLCTDGSAFAESIYRYGAWFATRLSAEVRVLSVIDIRSQKMASNSNLSGAIGLGASEELLNNLVEIEHQRAKLNHQKTKLILQNAEIALKEYGVAPINLIEKTGFLVDFLSEFEVESDLIVLGKRGEGADFASKHLGANVERIIRSIHKPCLVTPREFQPIKKVLIAYDGSPTGAKILQFLVNIPLFQDLELHLLTVAKSSEDSKIVLLNEAGQNLKAKGLNPICQIQAGNPEQVIVDYAQTQSINLLLMGAYGHNRIRQLVIGSTTAQVLRSSNIPLLLFR